MNVARPFSRAAATYDDVAQVQKSGFRRLAELSRGQMPKPLTIIDIGCGTGALTLSLAEQYPTADILAIDISDTMIKKAKQTHAHPRIKYKVANGEDFESEKKADLIFSNATFQWFSDLDLTIKKLKKGLNPDGILAFSIFGNQTFNELSDALQRVLGPTAKIPAATFLGIEDLQILLKKHFKNTTMQVDDFSSTFPSLWAFLRHLKQTGTRGYGLEGGPIWTRGLIEKVEREFLAHSGQLRCSYQLIYALVKNA